jgi:uncharacterized protein YfaS (alpha-2-macroglobulin family)
MTNQRLPSPVWREHVAQWRADGASMQSYADQHGLPATRFKYWINRLEREAQMARLLPMRIQAPVATAELALHSPSGWTMRIDTRVEPAWLAAVLSGLR